MLCSEGFHLVVKDVESFHCFPWFKSILRFVWKPLYSTRLILIKTSFSSCKLRLILCREERMLNWNKNLLKLPILSSFLTDTHDWSESLQDFSQNKQQLQTGSSMLTSWRMNSDGMPCVSFDLQWSESFLIGSNIWKLHHLMHEGPVNEGRLSPVMSYSAYLPLLRQSVESNGGAKSWKYAGLQ